MKKTWSTDPMQIIHELISVIELSLPLSIYSSQGAPTITTQILSVCGYNKTDYIVLYKPDNWWWAASHESYVLYKKEGVPARGFMLTLTKESEKTMAAVLPEEIFQIQRRRYPRIPAHTDSQATFLVKHKTQLSTCRVVDISLGGARLVGQPVYELKRGDELCPFTMILTLETDPSGIRDITIPSATVAWVQRISEVKVEVGVSFQLPAAKREQMNKYLDLRSWESRDGLDKE